MSAAEFWALTPGEWRVIEDAWWEDAVWREEQANQRAAQIISWLVKAMTGKTVRQEKITMRYKRARKKTETKREAGNRLRQTFESVNAVLGRPARKVGGA